MAETGLSGSFVARIWVEGVSDHNPTWRGHVQHVQGEEECYFQDLLELKEFLERISGVPLSPDYKGKREG